MRIGVDFDNTLVSYDTLFLRVALDLGVVPIGTPPSKLAVREYLRRQGREEIWTAMQGTVYGARMDEAEAYPGALDFLRWAASEGIGVAIVSHKTRHPFVGPQYDLHAAARRWVERHLGLGECALVPAQNVFFELTKEDKLRRIAATACDYFIDDLPEILLAEDFPRNVRRVLFDPDANHADAAPLRTMRSWPDIIEFFRGKCRSTG